MGNRIIECILTMPLETLRKTDHGFETMLKSLIPVVSYHLSVELDDNCGWEFPKDPDLRSMFLFSKENVEPADEFDFCGMAIQKKHQ